MANDKLVKQVDEAVRLLSLEDLKLIYHRVQQELSRRRDIGDRYTVERVMRLAEDLGWRKESGVDMVKYLAQCASKENV